jgi:cytochrome c oxidase assembly protein subunit 15
MTDSVIYSQLKSTSNTSTQSAVAKWIRRLVWKIAIATLILMAVGSATRVMNAGLACPDWPLCYGQLVPTAQMNLQVFLEWVHRLDAAVIGLSTMVLVGLTWWFRREFPKWLPYAATFALFLIVFQGILGGLTVTELLRFDLVTAHLGTALLFLATLVGIATALMPYQGTGIGGKFTGLGFLAALLIYIQSLLGGLVGSRWAVHQCLTVNIAQLCTVLNSHLIGVIPATLTPLLLAFLAWRTAALHPLLRQLASLAGILVSFQVLLGVATLRLHLQVEPLTVAHHTIGATLFAILVGFSVLAQREQQLTVYPSPFPDKL